MAKNLVIVESPAKAKTIKKFLGSSYKIEASMGHVRDLPKSELGVDVEQGFEPKYITIRGKGDILNKLRKEVKNADVVYLATDPDREGEAISWHLKTALKLEEKEVHRITFNEITKAAVKKSIKEARPIDMGLVNAQQSRRILDRFVGYRISPLLWKKVRRRLSAGRVQSVCLMLICDREQEIQAFNPEEYWTIEVDYKNSAKIKLTAKLVNKSGEKIEIKSAEESAAVVSELNKSESFVENIKRGKRARKPYPPFTTSTLQQEASKALGYSPQKTMQIAQQLYEGLEIKGKGAVGLVSYIRTDSVRLSDEAYNDTSKFIIEQYGTEYKNESRPVYKSKGKTQDAHEAIRPTDVTIEPFMLEPTATKEQYKLYKLIWERMVSSLMSPAVYDTLSVKIKSGEYTLRASASVLAFDGFLKIYSPKEDLEEEDGKISALINLSEGMKLDIAKINESQHFTSPPPRFSEASLVKTLEEDGIGRPSTYAPTIATILARGYVIKEAKNLYPTELGEIVNEIMKNYFHEVINVDFTAVMERELDMVEEGSRDWKQVIKEFYFPFEKTLEIAEKEIGEIEIEDEVSEIKCEKCGTNMVVKYGKYGKFLACPNFPDCRNTKPYFEDTGVTCPSCGGKILVKKTKKGRKFYGCENNPDCEFMTWNKPTEQKCPKCGSVMVEKMAKNNLITCTNCDYKTEKDSNAEN